MEHWKDKIIQSTIKFRNLIMYIRTLIETLFIIKTNEQEERNK